MNSDQTVYHVTPLTPHVDVKLIKNTKGYQWELSARDYESSEVSLAELAKVDAKLRTQYPTE